MDIQQNIIYSAETDQFKWYYFVVKTKDSKVAKQIRFISTQMDVGNNYYNSLIFESKTHLYVVPIRI